MGGDRSDQIQVDSWSRRERNCKKFHYLTYNQGRIKKKTTMLFVAINYIYCLVFIHVVQGSV